MKLPTDFLHVFAALAGAWQVLAAFRGLDDDGADTIKDKLITVMAIIVLLAIAAIFFTYAFGLHA